MRLASIWRKVTIVAALGVIAISAISAGFFAAGARINYTKSVPLGLYWISSKPIGKGQYVLLCPPPIEPIAEARKRGYLGAGFCPGNVGYMMKKISAVKDDVVTITDAGVTVNGVMVPLSKPMIADRWNRTMPRYQHTAFTIDENEVLVMGDVNWKSFDSRYFGPVLSKQIKTVVVPVFTW